MAKGRPAEPKSAQLNVEQMRVALPKIERRITDIKDFKIEEIRERSDSSADALADKINGTLQDIFGYDTIEYQKYSVSDLDTLPIYFGGDRFTVDQIREGYREGIQRALRKLETMKQLFEERIADAGNETLQAVRAPRPAPAVSRAEGSKRIFIVHGRDEAAKEMVARYISGLGLEPVILHEKANAGRTIIEKFETHAAVDYAIVLFTPDDVGYLAGSPQEARPRPRQNVVLELGFFHAALGRNHVCVLHRGDVEFPSDYDGIVYVPLDEAGAWRLLVARELRNSGIDVDLNRAL